MKLHSTVRFLVGDIVHPEPAQVLLDMYDKAFLEGEVVAVTNDGRDDVKFVIVRVPTLAQPVIVPLHKARPERQERPEERAPTVCRCPSL